MKLSCVSASYVNDLAGYPGEIDWVAAMETISRAPVLETLESILKRLAPARLDGIELWYPHVWPDNLTPELAGKVLDLLSAYGLVCCACAGSVGDPARNARDGEEMFRVARMLKAPLIAGHFEPQAVPRLGAMAAHHHIRVAFENSHEQDASQILSAIGEGNEWIGVNIDTGNLAAQGGDPVKAIRELGTRIIHVHFKDVPAAGSHECVALGKGIVDVAGVMRELRAIGYDGWLSIEVETGDRDPTGEILASAEMLRSLGA